MPWGDWQFWVVTALFLSALWLVLSAVVPRRRRRSRRVDLTVSGRKTKRP